MNQVEKEQEMKYLLLEKDFEHRDALDLITQYQIVEFLESQFAENVVKEICNHLRFPDSKISNLKFKIQCRKSRCQG